MRKLGFAILVVVALASFGAQAQELQQQDPAIVPGTEEAVQESLLTPGNIIVNNDVDIAAAATASSKRRRAVRSESPFLYRAGVSYLPTEGACSRVFGPLPVGTGFKDSVVKPDGTPLTVSEGAVWPNPIPYGWALMSIPSGREVWDKPLPVDWPTGVTKFVTTITRYGQVYTATNRVVVNMPTVSAADPLYPAVYPDGAVKLVGHDLVLVVGSEKVGFLELQAGNYIPAGEIKKFPVTLTGCWDVSPVPEGLVRLQSERTDLECSTVTVNK